MSNRLVRQSLAHVAHIAPSRLWRTAPALLLLCLPAVGAAAPAADTPAVTGAAQELAAERASPQSLAAENASAENGTGRRVAATGDAASSSRGRTEPLEASEADAVALVKCHLPELITLLETLRVKAPEQYRRAILDLARHARRLEMLGDRDPRLFEIELEILKRQTRVDLLVARLQLHDDLKLRTQLRRSVAQLQQSRLARLAYDRDQAGQRLARAQQQSEAADERWQAARAKTSQWVEQHYKTLLRRVGRAEPAPAASNSDRAIADTSPADESDLEPPDGPPADKPPAESTDKRLNQRRRIPSGSDHDESPDPGSPR